MISEIQLTIEAVKQWPIIVQGAAGSALFAMVSYCGRKITKTLLVKSARYSENIRKENLYRELLQKKYSRVADRGGKVTLIFIYQGLAFALRGLVFFALGQMWQPVFPLSSSIGALGLLYYLFKAVLWVEPYWIEPKTSDIELWLRVKEIEVALNGKAEDDTLEKIRRLSP